MGQIVIMLVFLTTVQFGHAANKDSFKIVIDRNSYAGAEKVEISINKSKSTLSMNSNIFQVDKMTRVGSFVWKSKSPYQEFSKLWDKVESQTQHKKAQSVISPHNSKLSVNGKPVEYDTHAYNEIFKWLPKVISKKQWDPIDAKYIAFLDQSLMIVETWEKGKFKGKKDFTPLFICKRRGPSVVCPTSMGIVYTPPEYDRLPASL